MTIEQPGGSVRVSEGRPADSVAGFQPGELRIDVITGNIYRNVGTVASSSWLLLTADNVYADATARDAAITSPVAGQTIYNTALGAMQTYTGSAWTGGQSMTVAASGTAAENGVNLLAAYALAKTLTPNGVALSPNNRLTLWLSPGVYLLAETLTLDQNYIDIAAMDPIATGFQGPNPGMSHPSGFSTRVTCAGGGKPTVIQTASYIRLIGFCIEQTGTTDGASMAASDCGLVVKTPSYGTTNASFYVGMYFRHPSSYQNVGDTPYGHVPVVAESGYDTEGTWINCVANQEGWRIINTSPRTRSVKLSGRFYQCHAGYSGFGGDPTGDGTYMPAITGFFYECSGGNESFAGCSAAGCEIEDGAEFWYCRAGTKSFAMGRKFDGKAYYCEGGANCFGGSSSATGVIIGYIGPNAVLIGCRTSVTGFGAGGKFSPYRSARVGNPYGKAGMQGKLIDCIIEDAISPIILTGGIISGGSFNAAAGTGIDAVIVDEDGGQITRADLIAEGSGNGITSQREVYFSSKGYDNSATGDRFSSGDALYTITYPTPLKASTITITYIVLGVTKTVTDDGAGNLVGDVDAGGTNTVDYATGLVDLSTVGTPDDGYVMTTTYDLDLVSGSGQPAVAACVLNAAFGANVSSSVSTPYNVIDSNLA